MARAKLTLRQNRKPAQNFCFVCGPDNPDGMALKFKYDEKNLRVTGHVRLSKRYCGPPGYCHGGIIATLIDEVMAKLNKLHEVIAVTGHLNVDYLRPVPLGQLLYIEAREVRASGRRRFREAEITNKGGEVLARGKGVFIAIDPQKIFAKSGNET